MPALEKPILYQGLSKITKIKVIKI